MTSATVQVPAKVNLSLSVGTVRSDGMHPLATVYQAVDLFDEVSATLREDGNITVRVEGNLGSSAALSVPHNDENLAVRAAMLLRERLADPTLGVHLTIRKSIPVAGGMAGGSADAAAALVACNEIWSAGLTRADLEPLAARLGSDVPFLLHGGIALGSGRGEKVSQVLAKGTYHWVFVTSDQGLSTAKVYAEFDRLYPDANRLPAVPDELMTALRAGDVIAVGECLNNDLQQAAISLRPELQERIIQGRSAGAVGAVVSGSGPTVAFLAASGEHALDLAMALTAVVSGSEILTAQGPVPGARLI